MEYRQAQIERRIKVENEDAKQMAHNWQNKILIDAKFHTHWNRFMDMVAEYESMRDGHSGLIRVAKYRI